MGTETAITWCDHTFNPWWGCFKISPGCKHCYASAFDHRLGGENWERSGPRRFFGDKHWNQPRRWARAAAKLDHRPRVFCASMSDVFEQHPDPAVSAQQDDARERLWNLIDETPELDWLLLTKRPENVATMIPWLDDDAQTNVWLGVTTEDQEYADLRLQILRALAPHVGRVFASYEPAIGRIDWTSHLVGEGRPDWIIFGDESGRQRRSAEIEWARETRDACATAGVAFHFKQWCGDDADGLGGERDKGRKIHLPILDGSQYPGFPAAVTP